MPAKSSARYTKTSAQALPSFAISKLLIVGGVGLISLLGLVGLVLLVRTVYLNFSPPPIDKLKEAREAVAYASKGYPEAEKLSKFLAEKGVNLEVNSKDYDLLEKERAKLKEGEFLFVVIRKHYNLEQSEGTNKDVFIAYDPHFPMIFFHESPNISREWLGIMLIHELKHAWDHLVDGWMVAPDLVNAAYIDIELDAHEIESQLANHISKGEFYRTAQQLVDEAWPIDPKQKVMSMSLQAYDRIHAHFPKIASNLELSVRQTTYLYTMNKLVVKKAGLSPDEQRNEMRLFYHTLRTRNRRLS